MPTRQVYFSGKFVPESEARVSIFDYALMYGEMAFEMTRTFNFQPFRLRQHLERLYAGLKILEIDCGLSIDEMEAATLETLEVNRDLYESGLDCMLMHNVSRGPLVHYWPAFPEGLKPTVTISTWPLKYQLAMLADGYIGGVHAVVPVQRSVPSRLIDPKIKNRSRIYYQVANQQVQHVDPNAWAILTDDDGFLTEGTGANFFIVKDGRLLTPRPHNILRGVSRSAVFDVARRIGVEAVECDLEPYDAAAADEAFYSSTPYSIMPATKFNCQPIADGQIGPVTKRIIAAWSEMVGVDIVAQSMRYKDEVALVPQA